ncbi:MAG: DUF192 domain-containing protein [Opitutaceae bacterium]|nr:DUF192 domain-containing protein [Opitutaceae bacterium]
MKNANLLSLFPGMAVLGLLLALLSGCGARDAQARREAEPISTWFDVTVDKLPLRVQLAVTSEEMARGLMGRRDLAQNQGMLFTYRSPTRMSFYMRNTPTPLDIGFFDSDGVLREVYPLYPYDEKTVASRSDELKYALEVNQGWFSANGVKPGARLDLAAVGKALEARGFEQR